jgi:hypothetical protein
VKAGRQKIPPLPEQRGERKSGGDGKKLDGKRISNKFTRVRSILLMTGGGVLARGRAKLDSRVAYSLLIRV